MKLSQVPRVAWYVGTFLAVVFVCVIALYHHNSHDEITDNDVHGMLQQMAKAQDAKWAETEHQGIFIVGIALEDSIKAYTTTYLVPGATATDFDGIESMLKDDYAQNLAEAFGEKRTLLEAMQTFHYNFASRYTNEYADLLRFITVSPSEVLLRMK